MELVAVMPIILLNGSLRKSNLMNELIMDKLMSNSSEISFINDFLSNFEKISYFLQPQ